MDSKLTLTNVGDGTLPYGHKPDNIEDPDTRTIQDAVDESKSELSFHVDIDMGDGKGLTVDYKSALPLKLRDWKKLKAEGIDIDTAANMELNMDEMAQLCHYVLHKADPMVNMDHVENLTMTQIANVVINMFRSEKDISRPS